MAETQAKNKDKAANTTSKITNARTKLLLADTKMGDPNYVRDRMATPKIQNPGAR